MSSIILFGKTPKATQVVSPALSAMGINLMKAAPSDMNATITLTNVQPGHVVFERYLSQYCRVSSTGTPRKLIDPYHSFQGTLPTFFNMPRLIFSFTIKMDDVRAQHIQTKYAATQTITRGGAAFVALANMTLMRDLVGEAGIDLNTPSTGKDMNIDGFRQYLVALKMVDAILRTNQYPYTHDDEEQDAFDDSVTHEHEPLVRIRQAAITTTEHAANTPQAHETANLAAHIVYAYSNLQGNYHTYDYSIRSTADLPGGFHGLLFPYVADLATPDRKIFPYFFKEYMYFGFGETWQAAESSFEAFKSGMGSIVGTPWGDSLAHLLGVMDISLKAQCTTKVMVDSQGKYQGAVLLGGGFRVRFGNHLIAPQPPAQMILDYASASPHISALTTIFGHLPYTTPVDRLAAQNTCGSLQALRALVLNVGLSEPTKIEILNSARRLSFGADPEYLSNTSHNLSNCLNAIANLSINITGLPLHPSCLFSLSRAEVVWSAFGPIAPSFRIKGSKAMSLKGSFSVEKTIKGVKEKAEVRKISVMSKPLAEAVADLEEVRSLQEILNPHGNAVVNRVSSDSLIRSFEKESAALVLGALRTFANVTLVTNAIAGPSNPRKRKQREDDQDLGGDVKRVAYDF